MATTKSNLAYERARRDIVTGVIAANQTIDEVELGDRYGLGRTPIREALKQLRNEQLIVWPDRRSPYVPEIGVAQVKSLYEARSIFESQIALLAAQRMTAPVAAGLERLVDQEADFVRRKMAYEAVEVDLQFHKGVAEATNNLFLVDASTRVNLTAMRIWHNMVVTEGMVAQEHADIVDALSAHDQERSRAAVELHITKSYQRYIHMTGPSHNGNPDRFAV